MIEVTPIDILNNPDYQFGKLPKYNLPMVELQAKFTSMLRRRVYQHTNQVLSEEIIYACIYAHEFGMFVSDCFHNTDYHAGFYVTSDPVAYNARVYKRTIGRNRPCLVIIGDLQEKIIVPTVVFNLSEKGKFFLSIFLPPL